MSAALGTFEGRVEWADTDASGHHHNTAIVRFVESAEAALVRGAGLTGYFGSAPRVRYEADFESRLWFGQRVVATVRVESVGRTSLTFVFEVWGQEHDGRPRVRAARGRFVTVHVPAGSDAAQPWPQQWIAALGLTDERKP
jgi:acyl-CoA thioester hydrolase